MDTITGTITSFKSETGNTNGNDWIRFIYKINDKDYSTFNQDIGKKFKGGDNVVITGKQSGKYWNMETMDYAEDAQVVSPVEASNEVVDLLRQILAELKK